MAMFSLEYLVESQVILLALYALYCAVIHRRVGFWASRIYLLSIVPVSLTMPLVELPLLPGREIVCQSATYEMPADIGFTLPMEDAAQPDMAVSDILMVVYLCVAGLFVAATMAGILRSLYVVRRSRRCVVCGRQVVVGPGGEAKVVFGRIIVGDRLLSNENIGQIIAHEESHVRLGHSADLIIMSAMRITLWFNPAVWHISRMLREIHEYQADECVLASGADRTGYMQLLLDSEMGVIDTSLSHSFSYLSIKKRIKMMTDKTKRGKARLLTAIPLVLLLMGAFCLTAKADIIIDGNQPDTFRSKTATVMGTTDGSLTVSDIHRSGNSDTTINVTSEKVYTTKSDAEVVSEKVYSKSSDGKVVSEKVSVKNSDGGTKAPALDSFTAQSAVKDNKENNTITFTGDKITVTTWHDEDVIRNQFQVYDTEGRITVDTTVVTPNNNPLFVVDGKPRRDVNTHNFNFATANENDFGKLLGIPGSDITSIEVLMDEMALKAWGERGKNGVVEVTTKSGSKKSEAAQSKNTGNGLIFIVDGRPRMDVDTKRFNFATADKDDFGRLLGIQGADIESIEVLMDEMAVKAWGEQGKNGVIIVNTKSGKTTIMDNPVFVINDRSTVIPDAAKINYATASKADISRVIGVQESEIQSIVTISDEAMLKSAWKKQGKNGILMITVNSSKYPHRK